MSTGVTALRVPAPVDVPIEAVPPLPAGEVHLWLADLDAAPGNLSLLDAAERERLERIIHAKGRARFVRARELLRRLLGAYAGTEPAGLAFGTRGEGKPFLTLPEEPVRFNLSHTGAAWLLAVARDREVGVDLERTDRPEPSARIAERIFSPNEVKHLDGLTPDRRVTNFFRVWTVREAVTKLRAEGIFTLSAGFDVVAEPGGGIRMNPHPGEPLRIRVGAVPAPADHVGALAIEGSPGTVRFFRLA